MERDYRELLFIPKEKKQSSPLTTCSDCGGQVSRNASACPQCGSKSFDLLHSIQQIGLALLQVGLALVVVAICLKLLGF
jgi:hypothetical protein